MTRKTLVYVAAGLMQLLILAGCSSQQVTMTDPERDPWEAYNRKIHSFNMAFDNAIFRPVAKGYDYVMPDAPQRGVRNFFRNLSYPVTFINLILQGKFEDSMTATGRFLMNSTVGMLGFVDVATKLDMPKYDEDFGQTLAVWGWRDSRYLVMPIFGPYTARDFIGRGFYGYFHPVSFAIREYNNYIPLVVDLISLRAELLPFQAELDAANDPYVLVRDVWLQNREFKIYDGDPPQPDYDALLEEY
ncbi:MAG: VacJ family lipoprotein [Xanthomonadales bacterium]|nr:VacJ family lipoprotein [Xanthomonadales bacterium]MDH3922968.1 VacJ family lipoprotein [Xanthomonadales bacterium]MDH3940225.1 VacJ family lipoprotein [Xanthomonadales bacterium]MDH3999670.1 VacJ family lipoprotein [Xanthomonadales bacterium]